MNLFWKTTLCLVLSTSVLFVSAPAAKAADEPGYNYVTLLASGVIADDDRKVDDGFAGAELGIGRVLHEHWNLEGMLAFLNMPADTSAGGVDLDQRSLTINALNVYNRGGAVEPYLLAGLGYIETTSYNRPDNNNVQVNLGGGVFVPVFGERTRLRAEMLWRWDDADVSYQDWIYNLGIVFQFGKKAAAAPPPPLPVAVVVTPTDEDLDGVYDDADQCPGTASGERVNEFGCVLDTDADGVPDSGDRCPNTAAGKKVDEFGCAIVVIIELPDVTFRSSSAMLLDGSSTSLNKAAQTLLDNPKLVVEVAGHTDSVGSDEANRDLSFHRADAVRNYLVEAGIDPARISARGYGEYEPVGDNDTDAGRAKNRRVELRVLQD